MLSLQPAFSSMKHTISAVLSALFMALGPASAQSADWSQNISAEAAQADLTALYDGLQSAHYNLHIHRSSEDYDARFAESMEAISAPLTRFGLWLELQKFTAYGNVAHARLDFPSQVYGTFRDNGGRAFPLYLRIVNGRTYVGEDYSGSDRVTPGDEILSIDGAPMARWLDRTAQYISADTPYIAHSVLESTFPMYLWVELGEREHYTLRIRKEDGRSQQVRIPALTKDELVAALEKAPEIFALDSSAREARMLTDEIAYLRPGPFYNAENPEQIWDKSAFATFVDDAFQTFLENDAQALVIDLRNNPGGDNSFSDPMISWIADRPFRFASKFLVRSSDEAAASNQARLDASSDALKGVSGLYAKAYEATPRGETFEFDIPLAEPREGARFEGKVYVLVNRHSYSNAVNAASIFQDYGWGKIAGELTADFATTYGAMEDFTLPNTGFKVGFPKAFIIRPSGDARLGGVQPDIVIQTPIVPSNRDVVLDHLVSKIVLDNQELSSK
jgi:hypothetical protein